MRITCMIMGVAAGLCVCGCQTAHKAGDKTEHVAKKAGHAVGNATEKVGSSIEHGGQKLEDKTDQ